ncbi:hypothetical protein QBC46DRAFT_410768 [Diplogelasinospora grovesii]|uniref:Uncharacterized protein n=1 Tax=Diplogelasinospora grovesii TaxID=303347 RepID=A0AAN6N2B9_9PEZI|nr:hypothetical protein QBC46DRAFT_410768 [Diplogelasinospora grovesii]
MSVPSWLRILLLVLSFASFLPQLRLLWVQRDSSGISLYYVLFNLLVATEQFTLSFFFVVNHRFEDTQVFVHTPPDVGDILNLTQFAVVWALWLMIFAACLTLPSDRDSDRPNLRATVSAILASFLFISVIPVVFDAVVNDPHDTYHKWLLDPFLNAHTTLVNPVVTVLGIYAFIVQACEILARPSGPGGSGALSLVGLAVQAIVFALLALAWLGRLAFPWEELAGRVNLLVLITWVQMVGFVPLDSAVFAVGQAILLWLALRRAWGGSSGMTAGETDPLLTG